jgi:hypothetical protein
MTWRAGSYDNLVSTGQDTVLTEEIRPREHGSQRATSPNPVKKIVAINKQITLKISKFAAISRLSHCHVNWQLGIAAT